MLAGADPLRERMTLFWHGHFTSSMQEVANSHEMIVQNQLLRRHALGSFRELTHAIARDPAMLGYLDNDRNRAGRPNENFARELMELFTLGEGHYTEADVKDAARAFTGWTNKDGRFFFFAKRHDHGEKDGPRRVRSAGRRRRDRHAAGAGRVSPVSRADADRVLRGCRGGGRARRAIRGRPSRRRLRRRRDARGALPRSRVLPARGRGRAHHEPDRLPRRRLSPPGARAAPADRVQRRRVPRRAAHGAPDRRGLARRRGLDHDVGLDAAGQPGRCVDGGGRAGRLPLRPDAHGRGWSGLEARAREGPQAARAAEARGGRALRLAAAPEPLVHDRRGAGAERSRDRARAHGAPAGHPARRGGSRGAGAHSGGGARGPGHRRGRARRARPRARPARRCFAASPTSC